METISKSLPLSFRGITINNFRGIRSASIDSVPAHTPWIFLTGNNGYGKSCLLQAIFLGFWGQNQDESTILQKAPFKLAFSGYHQGETFSIAIDEKKLNRHDEMERPVVAFGPSRLELLGLSASDETQKSTTSYSLFNPDGILLNIESELREWYLASRSKDLDNEEGKQFGEKYKNVVKALVQLMPNIAEIEVDVRDRKVWYTEKNADGEQLEGKRTLSEVASGSKSILAMVGDLMIRLFRKQKEALSPSELYGVAIIDEMDLHLHPKWQKALPGLLSKVFPKVQFIASTHSPIPFLGAPEGSVFLTVDRSQEEGVVIKNLEMNVSDFTPNLILSSPIFGFSEIFPITHEEGERIRTEETFQEMELNDRVEQRLKAFKDSAKENELLQLFKAQKGQ